MSLYSSFKLNRVESNAIPDDSGNGHKFFIVDCQIVDNPCEVTNKEFSKVAKNSNSWLGEITYPDNSNMPTYTLSFFVFSKNINNPLFTTCLSQTQYSIYAPAPGNSAAYGGIYTFRNKEDNKCYFGTGDTSESNLYDCYILTDYTKYLNTNNWNHICIVNKTYEYVNIFINRNLILSSAGSANGWYKATQLGLGNNTSKSFINSIDDCSATLFGYWSDVRMYDTALSDSEVYAIYDNFGIINKPKTPFTVTNTSKYIANEFIESGNKLIVTSDNVKCAELIENSSISNPKITRGGGVNL